MAAKELKSSSQPETDENPTSCVMNTSPDGDSGPEEGEIVGEVDSAESKGAVVNQTHPLEHSWTFWGASMRPIYTLSTAEEFWGLYNNIPHPSKLVAGADLYCFRNKIEPKWEDPLLAMIGEQFDHGDEVCGVVVTVRLRQEKVSLWTKNASNESAMVSIGKQWKEFLNYNETIGFIFHDDAKKLGKYAKDRYTV